MKKGVLLILLILTVLQSFSQVVPQDISNRNIYSFIDELADLRLITLISSIKPYSRQLIASSLAEADKQRERLNRRQIKELDFYLREYNTELKKDLSWFKKGKGIFKNNSHLGIPLNPFSFQYKDSLFTFCLKPIWGISYYSSAGNSSYPSRYHQWGGAEIFGYIGKRWGFYSNLRDHYQSLIMVDAGSFTQQEGASWKMNASGGGDYSEMRGGISFAWNWGHVLLAKDHFQWGDNYNGSNIFSGHPPSFPFFQLRMHPVKWLDYTFVTGWLVSQVVDVSNSYYVPNGLRNAYFNKFLSAASLTVTPLKGLNISAGGTVVSSSKNYNPALLTPLLFYMDYDYSGDTLQKKFYGTNPAFFVNISSRQIRHLHLYGSLFADDISKENLSIKAGAHLSWWNLMGTFEYTHNGEKVFTSDVPTLTFASNRYNMGFYLRNYSSDLFLSVQYKIIRGLSVTMSYDKAEYTLIDQTQSDNETISVFGDYEFVNNAHLFAGFTHQTALNYNILNGGFTIGF